MHYGRKSPDLIILNTLKLLPSFEEFPHPFHCKWLVQSSQDAIWHNIDTLLSSLTIAVSCHVLKCRTIEFRFLKSLQHGTFSKATVVKPYYWYFKFHYHFEGICESCRGIQSVPFLFGHRIYLPITQCTKQNENAEIIFVWS